MSESLTPQEMFENAAEGFAHWLYDETMFDLWEQASEETRERWVSYAKRVMESTPGANDPRLATYRAKRRCGCQMWRDGRYVKCNLPAGHWKRG